MRERWTKNSLLSIANNHIIDYPTATNISYLYGFGSLAGLMLVVQILTGIFLAMHYTAHNTPHHTQHVTPYPIQIHPTPF